ncbi:MAG: hypothetical protein AAFO07_15905 [Bacteroidota bacterium]
MTFLESITWDYVVVCLLSLAAMVYGFARIYKAAKEDDDDNRGGAKEPIEPILDLPKGVVTLDEWKKEKEQEAIL